ncbi:coiled-coil domain-containing protein [Rheinheimera gaetbuli]
MQNLDNTFELGFSSEYQIHELIFINSGSNYYVRLPVDHHAALISDNNSGKTSSLSALKLFLLPETSFKKQRDKFGFQSGGTFYQDLSSYTYYFPGSESYIICSASNPRGRFCWILHRTTDLGYERIAVPEEYNSIEHLFWNADSELNESAGTLHSGIGIAAIKKQLVSNFKAKAFNDRKNIGDAIYSRATNQDDDTRFCLLPMAKGFTTSGTETIRSLLGMAFSLGNASTTSLPKAISSILDGSGMSAVKKNNGEGILLDLDSQLHEWQTLKAEDARLKLVESQKGTFDSLQSARTNYYQLRGSLLDSFNRTVWSIELSKTALTSKQETLKKSVSDLHAELQAFRSEHDRLRSMESEAKSDHKSAVNWRNEIDTAIKSVEECRSKLLPLCPADSRNDQTLLAVLDEQIKDCETEIASLKDQAGTIEKMKYLTSVINSNKEELESRRKALDNIDSKLSFLDTITPDVASILLSINNNFAKLEVTPSAEQKAVIQTFAALFSSEAEAVYFCGAILPGVNLKRFNNADIKHELEGAIDVLMTKIERDEKQRATISQNCRLSKERQAEKLKECTEDLEDLRLQKQNLQGAELLNTQKTKAESDVIRSKELFDKATREFKSASEKFENLSRRYNLANEELTSVGDPLRELNNQISRLENLESISSRMLSLEQAKLETRHSEVISQSINQITVSVQSLKTQLSLVGEVRQECIDTMNLLLQYQIIPATPEERHQITTNSQFFEDMYGALQTVFLNLDQAKVKYRETLSHHNNTAAAAARIIENVEGIITNFISNINDEIKGYKISNLTSVTLVPELHAQYVDMTRTLNRIGSRTDELLSESFYIQISNFQNSFYNKQTGKVEIDKIIEKVRYQFVRNDTVEDTPQSNGTNCMINSVLLALLLQRLVPDDLSLSMPVVFDEIGSLDEKNFQEILKVMEEHNLYLFVANPEQNGLIASVLDTYHDLSLFKASDVGVLNKAEAIYYPGMEERLENMEFESELENVDEAMMSV